MVQRDQTVSHHEPEKLSAARHVLYISRGGAGSPSFPVSYYPYHQHPDCQTLPNYNRCSPVLPLVQELFGQGLVKQTFPVVFNFPFCVKNHVITDEKQQTYEINPKELPPCIYSQLAVYQVHLQLKVMQSNGAVLQYTLPP